MNNKASMCIQRLRTYRKTYNKISLLQLKSSLILQRASNQMKECSTKQWLLKAVEIGDCPDYFIEFHLDLHWSSHVLGWAVQDSPEWDEFLENLRALWKLDNDKMVLEFGEEENQSFITKVHECRRNDKRSLISKVTELLGGQGSPEDLQLASILNDRNEGCSDPSISPDLERCAKSFTFNIYHELFQHVRGGSSYVSKHRWACKKKFALKMALKPSEEADIIKKEAEIMEKCRHPYIVAVVGCWKIDSATSLMMMESMKRTLKELMKNERKMRKRSSRGGKGFSASEAIDLLLPVAKAMRNLQGREMLIAHRDIKPENNMCTGEPEDATELIDFGDSVEFDHSNSTRRYGVAGTTGYMVPEVRKCNSTSCDLLKADVFSFGMVFGELLTWKTPEEALRAQARVELSKSNLNDLLERGWRPHIPHDDVPNYVKFVVGGSPHQPGQYSEISV